MTGLKLRPYQGDEDYWRIRAFLREVFLRNGRRAVSWQTATFDYWRWHMVENVQVVASLEQSIFLWETAQGQLGAVLNLDNDHDAVLHVHPDFRSEALEIEMLTLAEQQFATAGNPFFILAHSRDLLRQSLLRQRGYSETGGTPEYQWRRDLTLPLPEPCPAPGYRVRAIGDVDELPARSWVSWRAFHPDEPDAAYEGWEWSLNWRRSPLYRRDLDIVATAPDGSIVGYCILWYDDVTRAGLFDPVAVMPEHQRRGLAQAMMTAAMRQAQAQGATLAFVGGYEPGPNALYASVLSPEYDLNTPWMKVMQG